MTANEEFGMGRLVVKKEKGSITVCCETDNRIHVFRHTQYYTTQTWEFQKSAIPDDHDGKIELAKRLEDYGVSLRDYTHSFTSDTYVAA